MMASIIDKHVSKFISRKFLVWLCSCGFLYGGMVTGEQWTFLSVVYIGGQAAIDAFLKWKGK